MAVAQTEQSCGSLGFCQANVNQKLFMIDDLHDRVSGDQYEQTIAVTRPSLKDSSFLGHAASLCC